MRRLIILSGIALMVSGCWGGSQHAVLAIVLSLDGDVGFQQQKTAERVALTVNIHPGAGSVLTTGPSSRVCLALLGSDLVELGPSSEMRIDDLSLTVDGNETSDPVSRRESRVSLEQGSISVSHQHRGQADSTFTLVTPNATLSTRASAALRVQCDSGKTRILCANGQLSVQSNAADAPVALAAGMVSVRSADQNNDFAAESDADAQHELVETLDAQANLLRLRKPLRNLLPGSDPPR